jgi:adenylate kinase
MKSIKIVGISGSGKSSLIKQALSNRPKAIQLGYSLMANLHGRSAVDDAWRISLNERHELYLIDEHLEFGDGMLERRYAEENTTGLLFLDVSPHELVRRRSRDVERKRECDLESIVFETALSRDRAERLSRSLRLPLLILHDASVRDGLAALESLI